MPSGNSDISKALAEWFADDSKTLSDIYERFHAETGLSYDQIQRRRNAYRKQHGLPQLRGRRSATADLPSVTDTEFEISPSNTQLIKSLDRIDKTLNRLIDTIEPLARALGRHE